MLTFHFGSGGTSISSSSVETPMGTMRVVATEHGIQEVAWLGLEDAEPGTEELRHEDYGHVNTLQQRALHWVQQTQRQLDEYFRGIRQEFDLNVSLQGTAFQQNVWRALSQIPYGETRSYRDIAISVGKPQAVRAVGQANRRNPVAVIIPCHRVVGVNGQLVGYAGSHVGLKADLLGLERRYG